MISKSKRMRYRWVVLSHSSHFRFPRNFFKEVPLLKIYRSRVGTQFQVYRDLLSDGLREVYVSLIRNKVPPQEVKVTVTHTFSRGFKGEINNS